MAAPTEVESSRTPGSMLWGVIREIVETAILAVIIWLAVNYLTARYVVVGESMEPTLHSGQYLIVDRMSYRLGEPQRGDIVVFDYPLNTTDDYVKRVIGLPGETVRISNGQVYVNDVALDEPYTSSETPGAQTWIVPEGSYFVLGDNRHSSSDSRSWGVLSREYIIGKVWASYWPPEHWAFISHYDYASAP
ncbi:MAG: signal peptidase I [Anaerolineae bacterium]